MDGWIERKANKAAGLNKSDNIIAQRCKSELTLQKVSRKQQTAALNHTMKKIQNHMRVKLILSKSISCIAAILKVMPSPGTQMTLCVRHAQTQSKC
jgi:hypothetical protein